MELKIWPLDVTYAVVGGYPEVRVFGLTEGGGRVVLVDRSFKPYFYVDCPTCEVGVVKSSLSRVAPVDEVSAAERRFLGRPRRFLMVVARVPEDVRRLREAAAQIPGVAGVYEADIRFYMRYMIDVGLLPCSWNRAEVEGGGKVGGLPQYTVVQWLGPAGGFPPPLRVLAFDIEVYNERGTPDPARDPVVMIAVKTDDGREEVFEAEGRDDRGVLRSFVEFVKSYDPDVVVGYNSNGFDWPYLAGRARAIGVPLRVDRLGGLPQQSVYGHWSIVGRANVDLYGIVEEFPEIKLKTLDRVAEYFGVMRREERVLIPGHKIYEYWRDPGKRPLLRQYVLDDVRSTLGLADKLLPFLIQLSSVSGLPLDQVAAASVGNRVEWMLLRYAYRLGEVAPNREEREYEPYKGAIVLEPKPGMYEDVLVLDFSSMYPNIMMKYNLSPDTYLEPGEPDPPEGVNAAPEVGHRFRRSPLGFVPQVLKSLVELRKAVREEAKRYPPDSPEFRILDERQRALKVMANAMYGYLGWVGARWYKREVAESVTAFARAILKDVIEQARRLGIVVVYGDTDSLFVKKHVNVDKLIQYVEEKYGIEIKVDKDYAKVLFTEAKKRYAGLLRDGRIDIVGFEVVRGDWSELAKEVQLKVVEIILNSRDVAEARRRVTQYVREIIERLREYKFNVDDLIIWKTLDKELGEYKAYPPHVHAALILKRHGYKVGKGNMVGYVVVKGGGKISEKALPYILLDDVKKIDVEYYIERQIIPAALRIAEVIGVKEADLKTGKSERSLLDFF
ncbi:DNA-directed DNA polymerase [Pyrobaculum neutrophilum]|uniref:DNA polymerase n=1 Tax=Pyrobaculum neutrophilum (strain DSM 2338 / JCM 9278 / NBRC 100436 / V24Sta) TaxID=444157 RepID=B1Y918_PYRNV|nr:DNA polymerase II [Pyrobaculum neutrophilum]ACB40247.1 DNA polymerase Pol2 [Pyrobaculum neutrophilum V24Sta]